MSVGVITEIYITYIVTVIFTRSALCGVTNATCTQSTYVRPQVSLRPQLELYRRAFLRYQAKCNIYASSEHTGTH